MADHHKRDFESVRKFLENKETNWYKLAEKLLTETDPNVREKFGINFFLNANFLVFQNSLN